MYSVTTAGLEALTNNIYKLQADILAEKLSNNTTYLKASSIKTKNFQPNTTQKALIPAINELVLNIDNVKASVQSGLENFSSIVGDTQMDIELRHKFESMKDNLINLVYDLAEKVKTLESLQAEHKEEMFEVNDETILSFTLAEKPINNQIAVYVNGVRYFEKFNAYSYDEDSNTVTWLLTKLNNGFDITNSEFIIEYDYYKVQTKGDKI